MSSRRLLPLIALTTALTACGGGNDDRASGPAYSLEACPVLVDGAQSFASGSLSYDVTIHLPEQPAGAPVVFVFHGNNGSPERISGPLGVDDLVDMGAIVISPQSAANTAFEWDFGSQPENNNDLQMFHDLLGCARRQFDIDLDRVWATGMSAGGLWSSYLVLHASNWLTAAAPFSGGVVAYPLPTARQIPVMLTWGGEQDIAEGFNFSATNTDLSFYLDDFGHPVIECVHDLGHSIPDEAPAMLVRFFRDQHWDEPYPFTGGLPPELPSWCSQR